MVEIKKVLEQTYIAIASYQTNRKDIEAENAMYAAVDNATIFLSQFKPYLPVYKQRYFQILESRRALHLNPRDLIMTFDRAVYELHSRLEQRLDVGPWSQELKELLDGRRQIPTADTSIPTEETAPDFIAAGLSVVGGVAVGPVRIIVGAVNPSAVTHGALIATRMTTPDLVLIIDKVAGIVTEQGGRFCHAALIAREFNIPTIVGCGPFLDQIRDGDILELDGDTGILLRR